LGRRIAYAVMGLATAVVLLVAATILLLNRIDLSAFVAPRVSTALGRPVSIAKLHITPGRWLTINLQGVKVANISGGTRPEMIELASLTAEVELLSLLRGPADVRRLEVNGFSLWLERVADGTANWRRDNAAPRAAEPEDRSWFPTLRDVHIQDSEIIERTSSRHNLPIRFDDATIRTIGPDAPVRMEVTGAYRDIPITLMADLQPIAMLRQAAVPYGTDFQLVSGDTTLHFQGTMTKPLAVDGANGTLTLHAPTLKTLLAVAGAPGGFAASLDLNGTLTRADALWALTGATGKLDDSTLAASALRLTDGGRDHPDKIDTDLAFNRLNLTSLLAGRSTGKDGAAFTIDANPDPLLAARITARQVSYAGSDATDLTAAAAISPGRIDLDNLGVTAFGARLQGSAHAEAGDKRNRFTAAASASGVDLQLLRRQIGARDMPMAGRLDAQLAADSTGDTVDQAVRTAHVAAVVSMRGGSISRDLVEKASTDIRRFFRAPTGMTAVSCLLAVIEMRGGVGTVSPLRIRTANGTIAGQGQFDLNRQSIDLTVGSQSGTTSDFALDVPFRINGPVSHPSVRPSIGRPALAQANLAALPAALSEVARQNPCISPR
jgi:AsmA family protein